MERLIEEVRAYHPWNEQEQKDREILLGWLQSGTEILTRNNPAAHLTASGWVITPDKRAVLMAYHNIYNSWAWLGGHADGEADLRLVAEREVKEESGLEQVQLVKESIFSLEILPVYGHVKRGIYVPTHLHLNVTYLFEGDPKAALRMKADENKGVQWIPAVDIPQMCTEPWMVEHIYRKLLDKIAES